MKILIIDDNGEWIVSVSRAFLRSSNVICEECHSATEAIVAIMKKTPDVLLLDHQLTEDGDEGFEVVEWVKKNNPKIEVYSTTSNSDAKESYAAMGIGWVDKRSLTELKKFIAEHTQ